MFMLIFQALSLSAQSDRLRHISSREGLSQGMIKDAIQDSEGYLWFCTKDGLNRYDGYSMRVFTNESQDSFSVIANEINCIFEDSRGWIWLGTPDQGLNIFDRKSERFFRVNSLAANGKSPDMEPIRCISEDHRGDIWFGTDERLYKLSLWKEINLKTQQKASLNAAFKIDLFHHTKEPVQAIYFEEHTVYWGTTIQLYIGSINNPGDINTNNEWKSTGHGSENSSITKILRDKYGALWLIHPHSMTRIKNGESRFFSFHIPLNQPKVGFFVDKNGDFLIGHKSLNRYKLEPNGELTPEKICDLNNLNCTQLFTDKSGIIWMGTNGVGVLTYNPWIDDFRHYMKGSSIQHLHADSAGRLFAWSQHRIHIMDGNTGNKTELPGLPPFFLKARNLIIDSKGRYWFHFPFEEDVLCLYMWDPVTKEIKQYPYNGEPFPMSFIYEDISGFLWISIRDGNLLRLNNITGEYIRVSMEDLPEIKGKKVLNNTLVQSAKGTYWLGTSFGLISFEMENGKAGKFKVYRNATSRPNELSENHILCIQPDLEDAHLLWIGTKGGGLNKLDILKGNFMHLRRKDGLPNDVIYGILPHKEQLWLSTNKGLSAYHPLSGSIQNYTADEGLQDNEFNTHSYFKTKDGSLVFGGINGITFFDPDHIRSNSVPPSIVITGMLAGNKVVSLSESSEHNGIPQFVFNHDQTQITFSFAALDFTASEKNEFKYRLRGVDMDWIYSGNRNEVNYTNLKPGKYTFELLGSNNSGVWAEIPAVRHFTILPPWWRTWWAYAAYILILGYTGYLVYTFQINKIRIKNKLIYETREAERLAELDRIRTNFFSNITHEFRTPLSLIIEPIRQIIPELDDDKHRSKLKLAEKNSTQLLHLVNQLLDLSKLEGGFMEVELSVGDLCALLESTEATFRSLAEKKKIEMAIHLPEWPQFLEFDRGKLELILNNLLSNAIKFTPEGGRVETILEIEKVDENHVLMECRVSDTGPGIGAEQLDKIFDRFYQVDDSITRKNEGTGIGLALTYELVTLMGGNIRVSSEIGKGTVFTVSLPMARGVALDYQSSTREMRTYQEDFTEHISLSENEASDTEKDIVLVVEDNPDLRAFICDSLRPVYNVIEAENGQTGIEKAIEYIPDLVISDIMMPVKNGFEVCESIKENILTAHIPVILLTAKSAMDSKIKGLKTGADDYLTKPFHTEELLVRMHNLIESRKQLRQKYSLEWKSDNGVSQENASFISEQDKAFISKMYEIIEEHLDFDTLSTDDMAKRMFISRVQLHRKIKALTDQSTSEFVRNYRLDRAKDMLRKREGNVTEIAGRTGFSSQKYFSARFKERFGVSPSEI